MQHPVNHETDLSFLTRKLNFFTPLEPGETAFLAALCKTRKTVSAHVDLIREGDEFSSIYILLKGWVAKHRTTSDGKRQIINFVLPGNFVCLDAEVLEQSDYTLTSVTPVIYGVCNVKSMLEMAQQFPSLAAAVAWAEMREEAIMIEHMVTLGQRSAYEAVAHLLLELHRRLEIRGMVDNGSFFLPLTQELIGEALGLTSIHVNRMLRRLEKEKLVAINHHSPRRIEIMDDAALMKIAGFDEHYLNFTRMPDRTKAALASLESVPSMKTPNHVLRHGAHIIEQQQTQFGESLEAESRPSPSRRISC